MRSPSFCHSSLRIDIALVACRRLTPDMGTNVIGTSSRCRPKGHGMRYGIVKHDSSLPRHGSPPSSGWRLIIKYATHVRHWQEDDRVYSCWAHCHNRSISSPFLCSSIKTGRLPEDWRCQKDQTCPWKLGRKNELKRDTDPLPKFQRSVLGQNRFVLTVDRGVLTP